MFATASARAANTKLISEATSVTRALPRNLADKDRFLFEQAFQHTIAPIYHLQIDNVTALSNGWLYQGLTLLADSFVCVRYPSRSSRLRGLGSRVLLGPRAQRIDHGTWISDNWSRNYFHWLTDAIPRLYVAKQHDAEMRLILPAAYKAIAYTDETLRPFELSSAVFIPADGAVQLDRLALPTNVADTGNYNEEVVRSIGELYRSYYGTNRPPGRRIYVSRSKAPVRKIVNEDEIHPILERYGFEVFHCENMTFSQQVALFSECAVLAGPHGAGFVNMMFMPPGGKVLEIHPFDTEINTCYFALSSAFTHNYHYMLSRTALPDVPSHLNNIIINPGDLEKNLEAMSQDFH